MSEYGVRITGTGSYLPETVVTNADLERMVDTSDEWIRTRTGIRERRVAAEDEPTSSLGFKAAQRALEAAGLQPEDLDLIIVATLAPDTIFPNTGCHLQRKLKARNAACFSLEAACSGFLYGFEVAANMIRHGAYRHILLVGAENITSLINWQDRNTCVLFGDGAGAVVVSQTRREEDALLSSSLGADGNYADLLYVPAGGSAMPVTHELLDQGKQYLTMNGREVFKLAVNGMVSASEAAMHSAGVRIEDIRWLVPHQANIRIIKAVGKRLEMPAERVYMNLQKYGNTSAATVPICLDELVRGGKVSRGDHLLLTAFGGGLTWGAQVLRWQ